MSSYTYLIKCIIVGDTYVGVEFLSKNVEIDDKIVRIQIWDTAGQESFKAITRSYYKNSACGILVFDITNRKSFDHMRSWYKDCKELSPKTSHIILVGNKVDMEDKRQVSTEEGQAFAEEFGIDYFEVSAKTGVGLEDMFNSIATTILNRIESGQINLKSEMTGIKVGLNDEESKAIKLKLKNSESISETQNRRSGCCK